MSSRDRQLFYDLSVQLNTPVCFSRLQSKPRVITVVGSVVPFYVVIVRDMAGVSLCLHRRSLFD